MSVRCSAFNIILSVGKLSISEIQQVWKAIKDLTQNRPNICCSALEIARQAGWDDSAGSEMETRVRTAISALETAGYIVRGRNVPKVFATSIRAKDMTEASYRIRSSSLFSEEQRTGVYGFGSENRSGDGAGEKQGRGEKLP